MDKFIRTLIITGLIVVVLGLLGWEFVLSSLPVQSQSGDNMSLLLWGATALSVFLIVVFIRIGRKNPTEEILDFESKTPANPEDQIRDPQRERSRIIFLVLIVVAMLAVAGIGIYTM